MIKTTYRRKSGLFTFNLKLASADASSAEVARAAAALISTVRQIANPVSVSLGTVSEGEDAVGWRAPIDAAIVADATAARPDAAEVMVTCDLLCLDTDGHEFVLSGDLLCWIELNDFTEPVNGRSLEVAVVLGTDIFAAISWGDQRDNRQLAALNAPRFNDFLNDLTTALGATVESVYAEGYTGQVDASGFIFASN